MHRINKAFRGSLRCLQEACLCLEGSLSPFWQLSKPHQVCYLLPVCNTAAPSLLGVGEGEAASLCVLGLVRQFIPSP